MRNKVNLESCKLVKKKSCNGSGFHIAIIIKTIFKGLGAKQTAARKISLTYI